MKRKICSFVLILAMFGMFVSMEAFASPQTHPNTYTNTGDQRADIIGVAKTQLGYTEGSNNDTKYGDWYGIPHADWCAMFVSWCARQANIPTSVLKNSSCAGWSSTYFNVTRYDGSSYTPKQGDLFFERDGSHVGLVYYLDGNYFYSIEGNHNNCVCSIKRSISGYYFGVPNYTNSSVNTADYPDNYKVSYSRVLYLKSQYMNGSDVLYMQHCLKYLGYSLDTDSWYGPGTASVVKQFQSDYGVSPVDGQCGSITWQAVETAVNRKKHPVVAPTQATIEINATNFEVGQTATFSFSGNNNTTGFTIGIDKDGTRILTQDVSSPFSISTLGEGNYSAYVTAWNSAGGCDSSRVSFTVTPKMFYLDLNGWLDGAESGSIGNYGTVDVYINGNLVADDVTDFVQFYPAGTTYEIKDIKAKDGKQYIGVHSGSLNGTLNDNLSVYLDFLTLMCQLDVNGWLDGTVASELYDYGTVDVYINGELVADDVSDFVYNYPMGTTYEIKDIKAKNGKQYNGVYSGALSGTINETTTINLNFSTKYPGKPSLSVTAGSNTFATTFSWNATSDTEWYDLRVFKKSDGSMVLEQSEIRGLTFSKTFASGAYYASLASCNGTYGTWTFGDDYIYFDVEKSYFIPKATAYSNGHIYSIYDDAMTWTDAKAQCEKAGGHLVTITSASEQSLVEGLLNNGGRDYYWLGASDAESEGAFKWVTGEAFSYTNWNSGQPDSWEGDEDYLHVYAAGDVGKWNDISLNANGSKVGFICEIETGSFKPIATAQYKSNKYELYDNVMAWSDAKAFAAGKGGHLVYIANAEEQNCVANLIKNSSRNGCWIGATDHNQSSWTWCDGSALNYKFWNDGEPNNSEGIEYFAEIITENGMWNDLPNIFEEAKGFIIEYENAATYTITYNANGGTGAPASQTKVHGTTLVLSSQKPTKDGYSFVKWTTNADGSGTSYTPGQQYTANAGITLYAQWIPVYYLDVNFNLDGENINDIQGIGSVDVYIDNQLVANDVGDHCLPYPEGSTFEITDIRVKDGYQYDGVVSGSLKGTMNGKTEVRLSFSTKNYTVAYNANGGTGAPAAQTKKYGENLTVSSTVPTRTDYEFLGWSTDKTATSATYQAGATFTANENTTLYAVWKKNTLSSVFLTNKPNKLTYSVGDTLDTTGLTLMAVYSNGSTKEITSGFTCTPTSLNTAGTQTITVAYGGKTATFDVTVTNVTPISITTQPKDATGAVNEKVTFTVKATGSGVKYQWYYKKADATSWTAWKNGTSASLTAPVYASWNGTQFYCKLTDANGSTLNSDSAKMLVATKITTQPKDATGAVNDKVTFSVSATGSGLTYQWYYKKPTDSSWTLWSGRTSASATATVYNGWNGTKYFCKITDANGKTINSGSAKLTVATPLAVTTQPKDATGAVNEKVTFTVKATGSGVKYQWYYKKADASSWTAWKNGTSASLTAPVYASWNGTKFYCKLTDANGKTLNSGSAKMFVATKITQQPVNATGAVNEKVTFTVKATGSGLTYQWYYKKPTDSSWTKWNGRTSASATATVYNSWNGTKYYCKITDANGKTVNSGSAKMIVK